MRNDQYNPHVGPAVAPEEAAAPVPEEAAAAAPVPEEAAAAPVPEEEEAAAAPVPEEEQQAAAPVPEEEQQAAAPVPEEEEEAAAAPVPEEEQQAAAPVPEEEQQAAAPVPEEEEQAAAPVSEEQQQAAAPVPGEQQAAAPVPGEAAAPAPEQETPASTKGTPPAEEPMSEFKSGKNHSGRKRAGQIILPVEYVRQRDGTHQLAIGQVVVVGPAKPPSLVAQCCATVGRIMLSSGKRGGASPSLFGYECNGLVIDARTWRALAVPPCSFNLHPTAKAINGFLAENLYDIIRVEDGTVVTLYSWEHPTDGPTWALASSNGYDVSSLYWIGPLSYAAVIYDLARRLYPAFVAETKMRLVTLADGGTRLDFETLDRGRCYTFGFRHHNFHPMRADPERMWQLQSADISGPVPRVIFSGNGHGLPGIPDQYIYAEGFLGATEVLSLEALNAAGANALAPGVHPVHNYGYILRSRDPARTREYSSVLVETPLLKRIRNIVYTRAPRAIRDILTSEDRLEYNAMRAFLTATERRDFLALYPDWAARFQEYEEFVNNVIYLVVHGLRQRATAGDMSPRGGGGRAADKPALKTPTSQVAYALLDHICRFEKLTAFHSDTRSIVHDYVVNPEYAYLFMRTMKARSASE